MKRLILPALVLAASPAWAQRWELALLGGYTTAGDIQKKAPQIQELRIDPAFTWGVEAGRFLSPHVGVEVSWTRQQSGLGLATSAGKTELFDVNVDELHGSFVYQLGGENGRLRPFVLGGLGATIFSALEPGSETKLSLALGAGLKWFPSAKVGARLQARYSPTHLNATSSDFCDPFGFCQGWLQQLDFMGGVTLRF